MIKEIRRRNAKIYKSYLTLFVCLTTKAVHLKILSDLSTVGFFAAFDRLIVRRGICRYVYSACDSNFIGVIKYLSEICKFFKTRVVNKVIGDSLSQRFMQWHHIPPYIRT